MADTYSVKTQGLVVGYSGQAVVAGLDLGLRAGQSLALVGQNGSGKSTLLKTLAGLLCPLSGTVEVLGDRPGSQPAKVAYLGQFHPAGLSLPLRAIDVVRMARYASLGLLRRPGPADEAAVLSAMEAVAVADLADKPLARLSGGQKQRVFIAQALAREASLLLLDEPSAGLDAPAIETYRRIIKESGARGVSSIIATHDIEEASACDLTLLLAGRVVAYGPSQEVLKPSTLLATFGILAKYQEGGLVALAHDHCHDPEHEHED